MLKKITSISFLSLSTLPLVEENINSIFIIITSILVVVNTIKNKEIIKPHKEIWVLSIVFWLFLIRELITLHPDFNLIIRYLPFLIFPLLFYYKPTYITQRFLKKSIHIFQISLFIKVIYYLILFFQNNNFNQLFFVNNENIPFFRDYIFTHSKIVVHPTYFSAFLLFSFTISIFTFIQNASIKNKIFNLFNLLFTTFFILLLSAKIIILLLPITGVSFFFLFKNSVKKKYLILVTLILSLLLISPLKNTFTKRFKELKTEINKPIKGNYYNSTNIRIAILKCSFNLISEMPFIGYGKKIQQKLNNCYKKNNESNFYLLNIYNTHNFYLHTLLYGGWVMLSLFLFYMIFLLVKNIKNYLAFVFLMQVMMINLTENFFQRHYGIVFFLYFISLLTISKKKEKQYVPKPSQI